MDAVEVVRDPDVVAGFTEDASGLVGTPSGVIRPRDAADVAEAVAWAHAHGTPITPAGRFTSTTGAPLAMEGLCLSMVGLGEAPEVDPERGSVVVGAGVVLSEVKEAAAQHGLLYPPDPTSEFECSVGGTVLTDASGARTLKYGATRPYVRRIWAVLGTGESVCWSRNEAEKNAAGYAPFRNPVDLLVGSEGTLGVVTRVELDLVAQPEAATGMMIFFGDLAAAVQFVVAARADRGLSPRAMELFDEAALEILRPHAGGLVIPDVDRASAALYVEQEHGHDAMEEALEPWLGLMATHGALVDDTLVADSEDRVLAIRRLRHSVPSTLNERARACRDDGGRKVSTDWAVPVHEIPAMVATADRLCQEAGVHAWTRYGHIGSGHPHYNLVARNAEELARYTGVAHAMCREAIARGGTVSAEHGIGKIKRDFFALQVAPIVLNAMRAVKRTFDPKGILAPGNLFP
jgi:FAD/FMN-containing dehydrogenase